MQLNYIKLTEDWYAFNSRTEHNRNKIQSILQYVQIRLPMQLMRCVVYCIDCESCLSLMKHNKRVVLLTV